MLCCCCWPTGQRLARSSCHISRPGHCTFLLQKIRKEKERLHLFALILMRSQVLSPAAQILVLVWLETPLVIVLVLVLLCCQEHRSLLEAVATSLRQDQCTSYRFIVPVWVAGIADQLCFAAAVVQQPQTVATS